MPWDFETKVDCYDILEYVKDNKSWFLEQLGESDNTYKEKMKELSQVIHDKCNNEFNFLRKLRDGISNLSDKEIIEKCKSLYTTIEEFGNYFGNYAKDKN